MDVRTWRALGFVVALAGCSTRDPLPLPGPDGSAFPPDASGDVAPEAASDVQCPNNWVCDGACVDLHTDPMHCGSCAHACAAGVACNTGFCP
jgi:hypothetical protein